MSFATNLSHGATYQDNHLLITPSPEASLKELAATAQTAGCAKIRQLGTMNIYEVRCNSITPMASRIRQLEKSSFIDWVEPAYIEAVEEWPDDLTQFQWHHHNEGQMIQDIQGVHGSDLGSLDAWREEQNRAAPLIALIDMGILPTHEDLVGQMAQNPNEICDNGIDDDENSYIDDCFGWDFGEQDNNPSPETLPEEKSTGSVCRKWHATGIASLAGAVGNNGQGIVGVHSKAKFLNLKKYPDESCVSTTTHSIEAIGYALEQEADILILAFSSSAYSPTYQLLLLDANEAGVFVVMSAGNGSKDVDSSIRYPNHYVIDYRATVANTDPTDSLWETSNWGATRVDFAAPGTHLLMAGVENSSHYHSRTGTSYSTGLAAGALSLAMSTYPDVNPDDLKSALFEGLTPLDSLDCNQSEACVLGGGRLSTAGLLRAAAQYAGEPSLDGQAAIIESDISARNYRLQPGEKLSLGITVRNTATMAAHDIQAVVRPLNGRESALQVPADPLELGDLLVGAQTSYWWDGLVEVTNDCRSDIRVSAEIELRSAEGASSILEVPIELHCNLDEDQDGFGRLRDCNDSDPRYYPGAEEEAYNCGTSAPSGCQSVPHTLWILFALAMTLVRSRRTCFS